jgi:hypothetical protein
MSAIDKILLKSLVRPFYRENAGLFVFVFTMMFFIVNKVDGAELFQYHYSLILASLKSNVILLLVIVVWFLYARKYVAYISELINRPEYSYLQIINSLSKAKRFRIFLLLEIWLLLPVLLYAVPIIIIGLRQKFYISVLFVVNTLLLISIAAAIWHLHQLHNPDKTRTFLRGKKSGWKSLAPSYPFLLTGFIVNQQKITWAGIKLFTCGMLYLIARNNSGEDYDIKAVYLFYSFGILANAIIIHRLREFEENYLSFYRGLPITLTKRFCQYGAVYGILLLPELIVIAFLAPAHLHYYDMLGFLLSSYSLVLFMNNLTFAVHSSMREFLKVSLLLFFVQYLVMMALGLYPLFLLFFISATVVFYTSYFKFERIL